MMYREEARVAHSRCPKTPSSRGGTVEDYQAKIDSVIEKDVQKIQVRVLRQIIPEMRKLCYRDELPHSGKKKIRHLWDRESQPEDWPEDVPFLDPNNGDRSGLKTEAQSRGKPGKEQLIKMFEFLKKKYRKLNLTQPVDEQASVPYTQNSTPFTMMSLPTAPLPGGFQEDSFQSMLDALLTPPQVPKFDTTAQLVDSMYQGLLLKFDQITQLASSHHEVHILIHKLTRAVQEMYTNEKDRFLEIGRQMESVLNNGMFTQKQENWEELITQCRSILNFGQPAGFGAPGEMKLCDLLKADFTDVELSAMTNVTSQYNLMNTQRENPSENDIQELKVNLRFPLSSNNNLTGIIQDRPTIRTAIDLQKGKPDLGTKVQDQTKHVQESMETDTSETMHELQTGQDNPLMPSSQHDNSLLESILSLQDDLASVTPVAPTLQTGECFVGSPPKAAITFPSDSAHERHNHSGIPPMPRDVQLTNPLQEQQQLQQQRSHQVLPPVTAGQVTHVGREAAEKLRSRGVPEEFITELLDYCGEKQLQSVACGDDKIVLDHSSSTGKKIIIDMAAPHPVRVERPGRDDMEATGKKRRTMDPPGTSSWQEALLRTQPKLAVAQQVALLDMQGRAAVAQTEQTSQMMMAPMGMQPQAVLQQMLPLRTKLQPAVAQQVVTVGMQPQAADAQQVAPLGMQLQPAVTQQVAPLGMQPQPAVTQQVAPLGMQQQPAMAQQVAPLATQPEMTVAQQSQAQPMMMASMMETNQVQTMQTEPEAPPMTLAQQPAEELMEDPLFPFFHAIPSVVQELEMEYDSDL